MLKYVNSYYYYYWCWYYYYYYYYIHDYYYDEIAQKYQTGGYCEKKKKMTMLKSMRLNLGEKDCEGIQKMMDCDVSSPAGDMEKGV